MTDDISPPTGMVPLALISNQSRDSIFLERAEEPISQVRVPLMTSFNNKKF